ncbi:MAG: Ohr family peroxiredoxin [Acholeplasmataceae bacterium]|nr:Ohr family peroxiredoxin [Acholeplasmataceae bacterium]
MKKFLERTATTYGGRDGEIKDTQSRYSVKLSKPAEMGGQNPTGTNPEELFSMGYSSCFASSLEYLLLANNVAYESLSVRADTSLMMDEETGFQFALNVKVRIKGVSKEVEKEYTQKAYGFCPYSKAIRGNIEVKFID